MTEQDWDTADPRQMLLHLRNAGFSSARKMRLVAVHYARWLETLPENEDCRRVTHLAEELADEQLTLDEVRYQMWGCQGYNWKLANLTLVADEQIAPALLKDLHLFAEEEDRAAGRNPAIRNDLLRSCLRCLFGNPFRPVACDPSWRTSTAVGLAEAIYADRGFDRLPILADALEDAGCTHPDVLAHCRGDGSHARGCWVVDLVLGKA